jgi:23S rRNA (cytidine1920-2'-O)/16S rRNA (cytidine1409-2'-O)-methyltransferase
LSGGALCPIIVGVTKRRIDLLLVDRGLAETQSKGQAMIMAGEVACDGKPVTKPGALVDEDADLTLAQPPPFVGRGGMKLESALNRFDLDVSGMVIADVGASTGGFTDCLLQRGARRVYAIDVGKGQLDWRLRKDPRVVTLERVNARFPLDLPERMDLATIDVSFISLEKVIPSVAESVKAGGQIVALIKPQFEALRREVGRGGVVTDPAVQARVLGRFIKWVAAERFRLRGLVASPILGASGNREFFVLLSPSPAAQKDS